VPVSSTPWFDVEAIEAALAACPPVMMLTAIAPVTPAASKPLMLYPLILLKKRRQCRVTNGGRTTITRITTGGTVTNIGINSHSAVGIAPGPGGAMWFTAGGAVIGRITTTATTG
jgi:hypothetical protein